MPLTMAELGGGGLGEYTFKRGRAGSVNVYVDGQFRARVTEEMAGRLSRQQQDQARREYGQGSGDSFSQGQRDYFEFQRKAQGGTLPPGVRTAREYVAHKAREEARTAWRGFQPDPPAWSERRDERRGTYEELLETRRSRREEAVERNRMSNATRDRIRERMRQQREDRADRARTRQEAAEGRASERRARSRRRAEMDRQQRREEARAHNDRIKAANKAKVDAQRNKMKGMSDEQLEAIANNPNAPGWQRRLADAVRARRAYEGGGTHTGRPAYVSTRPPARVPTITSYSTPSRRAFASSAGVTSVAMPGGGRQVTIARPTTGGGVTYGQPAPGLRVAPHLQNVYARQARSGVPSGGPVAAGTAYRTMGGLAGSEGRVLAGLG